MWIVISSSILKRKLEDDAVGCTSTCSSGDGPNLRKYVHWHFTSLEVGGEEKLQCVICLNVLDAESTN